MSDTKGELIGRRFPVLDQGWVSLADCMGTDQTIVDRARGTTGTESVSPAKDRDLRRMMMRHAHGSSFEFPEVDIQFCAPFMSWRQIIRHRAGNMVDDASMYDEPSVNELSGRYSEVPDAIQATGPGEWRRQSRSNRQGSDGFFPAPEGENLSAVERYATETARGAYRTLVDAGVAREQARKVWPMGGYTVGFVKMDLRNWLGWLALRLPADVQAETRAYAEVIAREIIRPLYPETYAAFEDYVLNAITLSALDIEAIRNIMGRSGVQDADLGLALAHIENRRERDECRAKLARLGIIND